MTNLASLLSEPYFLGLLSLIIAFLLSNRMYPVIIYTVRTKNLMDEPGDRSMHGTKTPTLGGVGLFAAFAIPLILFVLLVDPEKADLIKILSLTAAIMILLFLGIKDDLIALSARKKFAGQLIASAIVIFVADIRITDFNGLLGISELPYVASVFFTLFVFVLIINSYNMIDGIDGLAGTLALIASAFFGIFFLKNNDTYLTLVSFVLIGSLIGFLKYNLSSKRKLFMGDSGSLFIGYLLAYQGVCFLGINESPEVIYRVPNAQILFIAILSFPLLDTLRVFIIRIANGRSPFRADRNHIHHRLLHLGLEHKRATLVIAFSNVLLVIVVFMINDLKNSFQLLVSVALGVLLYLSPFIALKYRQSKTVKFIDVKHEIVPPFAVNQKKDGLRKEEAPSEFLDLSPTGGVKGSEPETADENVVYGKPEIQKSETSGVIAKRLEVLKKMMPQAKQKN